MAKNSLLLGILIIAAVFLLFLSPLLNLRNLFSSETPGNDNLSALIIENNNLKTELTAWKGSGSHSPVAQPGKTTEVFVYSRYPFNLKNELLINAGADFGITSNRAVLFRKIFIGKTEQVQKNKTSVMTVFDSRFQLAVRIGEKAVEALLVGGNRPRLTLIPRGTQIYVGDKIYSASPDFPYGLPIGEVLNTMISADQSFGEADVKFDYDLNNVRAVSVLNEN